MVEHAPPRGSGIKDNGSVLPPVQQNLFTSTPVSTSLSPTEQRLELLRMGSSAIARPDTHSYNILLFLVSAN